MQDSHKKGSSTKGFGFGGELKKGLCCGFHEKIEESDSVCFHESIELMRKRENNMECASGKEAFGYLLSPLLAVIAATCGTVSVATTTIANNLFMTAVPTVPQRVAVVAVGTANHAVENNASVSTQALRKLWTRLENSLNNSTCRQTSSRSSIFSFAVAVIVLVTCR